MRTDNTAALTAATQRRAQSTRQRARDALQTSTTPAPPSPTPPSLTLPESPAPCSIAIPSYASRSTDFEHRPPAAPDNPPPSA